MRETCWLYVAVSSDGQADDLEATRADLHRLADQKGWTVTKESIGIATAKHGVRGTFTDLIAALRSAKVKPTWVLTTRLDRISRGDILEALNALEDVMKLGVRIWTRIGDKEYKQDSVADLVTGILGLGQGQADNQVRKDKINAVYRKRILEAQALGIANPIVGNRQPYGLAWSITGVTAQEPQAETVREIFRLRLQGLGHTRIFQAVERIAPPTTYKRGKYGNRPVRWTTQRIAYILKNRRYVPTVIDEATFAAANRVNANLGIQSTRPQRIHPFQLSTALKCWCGRKMNGVCAGPARQRIMYYVCKANWYHDSKLRMVRASILEDQFGKMLREAKTDPKRIADHNASGRAISSKALRQGIKDAKNSLASASTKHARIVDAYENGAIPLKDLKSRLAQHETDIEELRAHIAQLESELASALESEAIEKDGAELITKLATLYLNGDIEEKREVAKVFAMRWGLCVEPDNKLTLRKAVDTGRQRKPQAREM